MLGLIHRRSGEVRFKGISPAGPLDAAGWLPGIRAEEHCQPGDGLLIVFAPATHIADPGGEVWDGDQFLSEPGEVGNMAQMHDACGTLVAGVSFGSEHGTCFVHSRILGLLTGVDFFGMVDDLPLGRGPIDQDGFADHILDREQAPLV